jgi:DNA-binding MarR family transcriptional regulator
MTTDAAEFAECRTCRCFAVRKASRAVTQHYDRALRKTGMRVSQFNTLTVLTQTGPLPMASLAEFMGLDRTSLTRNLQPPVKKRWVRIEPSDEDRRVRVVSITAAGVTTLRKALPAWRAAQAGVDAVLKQAGLAVIG